MPPTKARRTSHAKVLGVVVLIVAIFVAADVYLPSASVLPGYEGPHFVFAAFQPSGTQQVYAANANATSLCLANFQQCSFVQKAPSTGQFAAGQEGAYSWEYDQTHTTATLSPPCGLFTVYVCGQASNNINVDIKPACQAPVLAQTISYVTRSAGFQTTGQVYSTTCQLSLVSHGNFNLQFHDDQLWMAVYDEAWNNVNENGPQNGASWSTPLLLEFLGAPTPPAQAGSAAQNYQTNPGTTSGIEPMTLYSIPQTTSSFGNLLTSPSGVYAINSTLASSGLVYPDSQMLEYGFFPVTLTDFGSFGCGGLLGLGQGECDNTLQLSFQLYTLQLGTSTWSNPVTSTQTTQTNNCQGAGCTIGNTLSGISGWISNPLNDSLLFLIAVVVLVLLFAPELVTALVGAAAARRSG